jgi:hypothetical protein
MKGTEPPLLIKKGKSPVFLAGGERQFLSRVLEKENGEMGKSGDMNEMDVL